MPNISKTQIDAALGQVQEIVNSSNNNQDQEYFHFHRDRYRRMAITLTKKAVPGSIILEIGSHYLHSTLLLTLLGYKVHAMDVGAFCELPFVKNRVSEFKLTNIIENDLSTLSSLKDKKDAYDVILFTEILEHITFNPIDFWKHVFRLLKNGAFIYITTPNSFTVYNFLRTLKNLLLFKGIGINLDMIFQNVTYGHHWKEYNAAEIRSYFKRLSEGFTVEVNTYFYKQIGSNDLRSTLRSLLFKIGNLVPYFRDELEAIVFVDKTKIWKAETPKF